MSDRMTVTQFQPSFTQRPGPASPACAAPGIDALKAKMKATWMDGDYARFATYMAPGARQILAGWNVAQGERLLDVACGAGQLTIPAARGAAWLRQHFLYFLPLPHGQGSLRPILSMDSVVSRSGVEFEA